LADARARAEVRVAIALGGEGSRSPVAGNAGR